MYHPDVEKMRFFMPKWRSGIQNTHSTWHTFQQVQSKMLMLKYNCINEDHEIEMLSLSKSILSALSLQVSHWNLKKTFRYLISVNVVTQPCQRLHGETAHNSSGHHELLHPSRWAEGIWVTLMTFLDSYHHG